MGNTASNGHKVTAQDRAILDLKLQRDKLRQYQKKIGSVLLREREIAKECLARGDRNRALLALRRRKYQESLLAKTDAQLETLEQLTSSIEFALVEKDVLFGLKQGNSVLKQIQKEMSLDKVEKLMDQTADAIQYQREVSAMLAGNMSNAEEDEVEDELAAMEREAKEAEEASKKRLSTKSLLDPKRLSADSASIHSRHASQDSKNGVLSRQASHDRIPRVMVEPPHDLPQAPKTEPAEEMEKARRAKEKGRARARQERERAAEQPMLAS